MGLDVVTLGLGGIRIHIFMLGFGRREASLSGVIPVGTSCQAWKEDGDFTVTSKKKKKGKGKGKGSTGPRKVRCEPGTQAFADELMMDISRSSLAWSLIAQFWGKVGNHRI